MLEAEIEYLYDEDFNALASDAANPLVLLDFTADWCAPCIAMEPVVKAVAAQYANRVRVMKVDLDYSPGITDHFSVLSIPTLIMLKKGEPVGRIRGPQTRQSLLSQLDAMIAENSER